MNTFLYRRGNGNEGNFPRHLVELNPGEEWSALAALVENDFIAGHHRRRWIREHLEIDGDGGEYGVHAVISEGPRHATEMGAAWLTAELQHVAAADLDYWAGHSGLSDNGKPYALADVLDRTARLHFQRRMAKGL